MANGVSKTSTGRRWLGWMWTLMMVCSLSVLFSPQSRADGAAAEYQVKAAFLLNFLQFIDWPPKCFADEHSPMVVGVLGDDPFGDTLERTFRDESVRGRPVVVRRSRQVEDLRDCHLLFIGRSEKDHIGEIIASLDDASIATVSEVDDFCERGGVIRFYLDGKKVRFAINPGAAERRALRISAQLLKRARVIGTETAQSRR